MLHGEPVSKITVVNVRLVPMSITSPDKNVHLESLMRMLDCHHGSDITIDAYVHDSPMAVMGRYPMDWSRNFAYLTHF